MNNSCGWKISVKFRRNTKIAEIVKLYMLDSNKREGGGGGAIDPGVAAPSCLLPVDSSRQGEPSFRPFPRF